MCAAFTSQLRCTRTNARANEDSTAATDMNLVMTGAGKFVEVQGTAERDPFDVATLGRLLALGKKGIDELIAAQKAVLGK